MIAFLRAWRQQNRSTTTYRSAVLGLLALSACGYRVVRADAPFGQHTLAVLPFMETNANGMSTPLAQALIRRLAAGGVAVTNDAGAADAVLSGSIEVKDAAATTMRQVQMYTVIARAHAELRTSAGQILWQHELQLGDDFLPTDAAAGAQPLVTEARRRTALLRLAEQMAEALQRALSWRSHLQTMDILPASTS